MPRNVSKTNAGNYAKNVLKSVGYISVGAIKGVNPSMTSFISQNVSSVKDMYENVKDFKYNAKENMSKFVDSEYAKFGKELAANLVEDLKSGKFYNPERQSKYEDQYMSDLGFSMDDDSYDWDDDEEKSAEPVTANTVQSVGNMIISANGVSLNSATKRIIAGHKASTNAILSFNREAFGKVNVSLAAINTSILSLHEDIAKPLNGHIQNSTAFYKNTTEQIAKQVSLLEHIDKMLTDRFEPKKKTGFDSVTKKTTAWSNTFGGDLPDLSEWAKGARGNVSGVTDSISAIMAFREMFSPEMLQNLKIGGQYASPVATLLSLLLGAGLRRTSWGKSANRANARLKDLAAAGIGRMQRRAGDGTIFGLISSIFNIAPEAKTKFGTSNYNKGRQDPSCSYGFVRGGLYSSDAAGSE